MGPKWAIWTHISHYFPFSAYMGELQKKSVDRMGIKYDILQFIKCQW